ncbi:hypothetical protein L21SP2_1688 [Salinispira pacifica]|uniref:Uncharacterized protein n=1 Tax=Salinispira pacifica TaxID=1307761 RepID=V5WIU3_9SPIO|nr:hypothetical protein L21SP2_1688 [Salinispira pacifica]
MVQGFRSPSTAINHDVFVAFYQNIIVLVVFLGKCAPCTHRENSQLTVIMQLKRLVQFPYLQKRFLFHELLTV